MFGVPGTKHLSSSCSFTHNRICATYRTHVHDRQRDRPTDLDRTSYHTSNHHHGRKKTTQNPIHDDVAHCMRNVDHTRHTHGHNMMGRYDTFAVYSLDTRRSARKNTNTKTNSPMHVDQRHLRAFSTPAMVILAVVASVCCQSRRASISFDLIITHT